MNKDNTPNDHKPAFSILDPNGQYYEYCLTKREYFIASAMQGLCASRGFMLNPTNIDTENLTYWATIIADLQLKSL